MKILIQIVIIILILTSCSRSKLDSKELAFGLNSLSSMNDIQDIIKKRGGEIRIIENNHLIKSDIRPEFKIIKISTNIFKDKSLSGQTILEFYNNQLLSITFYPSNQTKYKNVSKKNINGVKINTGIDFQNKYYKKWEDKDLLKNLNQWIEKYSLIATMLNIEVG